MSRERRESTIAGNIDAGDQQDNATAPNSAQRRRTSAQVRFAWVRNQRHAIVAIWICLPGSG